VKEKCKNRKHRRTTRIEDVRMGRYT